jgi:HlyD family secretion protein
MGEKPRWSLHFNRLEKFTPLARGLLLDSIDDQGAHMIREASSMDKPIDHEPARTRRRVTLLAAAAIVVIGAVLLAPSVGRWATSETSVSGSQIRVGAVGRGDLVREVTADGRVVAASSPTSFSPAQGIVTIEVEAGEVVEAGRLLARVESPELENRLEQERATLAATVSDHERLSISNRQRRLENRQDVELAEVRVAAARRSLDRHRRLFDLGLVNEIDLEAAKDDLTVRTLELGQAERREELEREMHRFELADAGQRLERQRLLVADLQRRVDALDVRAPVAGQVSRLHVEDRQAVARNDALITVVDLTALEVELAVAENLADEVTPGTPAMITVGGETHRGAVVGISPEVEGSRVRGRVAFAAELPGGLKQNQRVSVRIILETRSDVLKVARGPWLEAGSGRTAYVVADGLAELRTIETGATSISEVEIVSGLGRDEEIVISDTSAFDGARRVLVR